MTTADDDETPRVPLRTITVEIYAGNDFTIREGDRYCDRLCWDECLGSLAELTHPRIGEARYRMWTAEEYAADERRRAVGVDLKRKAAEQPVVNSERSQDRGR